MYKLLIVDDEQIVLDSVRYIVENYMGNSLVTETARSGREAIEKADAFRPDIVVIDIKMPGISGLEAIAEIKRFHAGALFIVITAHEKFDFARDALHLGAIDYINKPIARGKLVAAIENAVARKDEEHRKLAAELELREKLAFIQPALESGFIYSMLFADDHSAELESFKRIFDVDLSGGYVMTVEYFGLRGAGAPNRMSAAVTSQKLYPAMRDAMKECATCIVGPPMLNRVVAWVPCDYGAPEYEQRIGALTTAAAIYEKLKALDGRAVFSIGIGKSHADISYAARSYEESVKALGYAETGGVFHINDIPLEQGHGRKYPDGDEKALLKHIEAGDAGESLNAFSRIFEWLRDEYGGDQRQIAPRLSELVVLLGRIAKDYGAGECFGRDFLREFLAIDELSALRSWLTNRIRGICEEIGFIRERKLSGVILAAREYISANYCREITLEDVSREVSVSPNYFSKLFKDETGSNFIDYLTALRIEKAKKLLADSKYVNKEICYQIGYADPNYFSRIFKKTVGMTPTEYRSAHLSFGQ